MIDNSPAVVGFAPAFGDLDAAAFAYACAARTGSEAECADRREQFTRECLPFASRMARRYRGRGESPDDLEQVARLGLVKAIDRYDPERGSFTAYAVMTVSGEIKRHFRDRTWGVHVPRRVQERSLEVRHVSSVLSHELSREPTPAEIANHLQIEVSAVEEALSTAAGYRLSSLNAPIGTDEQMSEFGDLFGDLDADLERVDDRITVSRLMKLVPPRESRILALRFHGNKTQAEIARELGISQMHVSRLLNQTLAWVRAAMLSDEPPRWRSGDLPDHPAVSVTVSHDSDHTVVRLSGDIDQDTVAKVRLALRGAVISAVGGVVQVDLAGVPMAAAAAAAVLFDAASAARLAGVSLRLVNASPLVTRALTACGLDRLLG